MTLRGVVIGFDRKIIDTAVILGIYIYKNPIAWLTSDQIDFTDLGNLIYWDGRAWQRRGTEDLYIVLPKSIIDLYPSAKIIGEVNVEEIELIDKTEYFPSIVELEKVILLHED